MSRRISQNVSLTPEHDRFVKEQVGSGRYLTASEVMRDALRLLQERAAAAANDTAPEVNDLPHLDDRMLRADEARMLKILDIETVRFEQGSDMLGRWFDVHAFRVGTPENHRVAILFNDISERKREEEARRASEVRQRFLLKLSDALRAERGAKAVADRALRMLSEEMELDRCYVGIYQLDEDWAEFPYQVGRAGLPPLPDGVRLSDFPDALRVAHGGTLVIDDVGASEGLSDLDKKNFEGLGMCALVVATLRAGENRPLWAIVAASTQPRHWTSGEITLLEEATERTWAAMERARTEAQLREAQQRQKMAADAAGLGVCEWIIAEDRAIWDDERIYEIFGQPPDAGPIGLQQFMREFIHPGDRASFPAALDAGMRTGTLRTACRIIRASDGQCRWVEFTGRFERDVAGRSERFVGFVADITERKQAEEHQNMLMAELDHRVKNILAVVQSIAHLSLGRGAGPDAPDRLVGRITALAQSHSLLAGSRWEGASFRALVEGAIAPYRGAEADRVVTAGPDFQVTPKAAQTLSLALHELFTNAAKYGALSCPQGRVRAEWHMTGDRLVFTWREQGGPLIEVPPARKGFGSLLIERTLSAELAGEVVLDYARDGLRAVIDLPFGTLRADERQRDIATDRSGTPTAWDRSGLRGRRLLVVEDDFLLGEQAATTLRDSGCEVTGPVPRLEEALTTAATAHFDAAVLDINLNGEPVWPVARVLGARGIPLVFATGYSATLKAPPDLADAERIEKPFHPDQLVRILAAAVARHTGR